MQIKINGQTISLAAPEPFLSILRREKIYFPLYCGGRGTCGKCRIRITEGSLPITTEDRQFFSEDELKAGYRLGCRAVITASCAITFEKIQREDAFYVPPVQHAESLVREPIQRQNTAEAYGLKPDKDSRMPDKVSLSIAVDIGSTTLVMALVHTDSGKIVTEYRGLNHQRSYGTDVMARIKAAVEDGQEQAMQALIRQDLAEGIVSLLKSADAPIEQIVIAGNTTMLHLLRGYDCRGLSAWPFQPVNLDFEELSTAELLGESLLVENCLLKETKVTLIAGISAFVGADITAGLWGCGIAGNEKPRLFLDLGTNAEMAVGNKEGLLVSSAAAGPAFEGGQLSCGTGSIPGAVRDVRIQYGLVRYETIGRKSPVGICGSGLVSAISEMRKSRMMDNTGRLSLRYASRGLEIIPGKIVITQADIREYQKARAAIRAGLEILVENAGYRMEEIEALELAGGFGSQLDIAKAAGAGLIPEELAERVHILGNAVIAGLCMYIQCPDQEGIRRMIQHTREISLANQPKFTKTFLEFSHF